MVTTNNINIALPFRHLNEDEMSSMYRCNSTDGERKLNSGCSLYINENISYKVRKNLKLSESVFIEVSKNIFKKNRNIILGVIYRSPDSQLSMFNDSLENILIQIDNLKNIPYLSGDYNVNTAGVLSCKSRTIHDFINIYSSFHYHKLINQPTRIILHKIYIYTYSTY